MRIVSVALVAVVLGGCSEPLVFPDWTVPVPEDVRVVGYADATDEDREGNRIEVVEDLVIGPRGDDENYSFFRPTDVLVDAAGRIYVFDSGNNRIQVFDASGEYLRTLGRAGTGPGEFGGRGGFITVYTAIAGDRVIAFDYGQSRLSIWGTDGVHRADHAFTGIRVAGIVAGIDDGSLVVEAVEYTDAGSTHGVVALSAEGEPLREYVRLPQPGTVRLGERIALPNYAGEPELAAASDGTVYATAGDEYQVLAFAPDGDPRWALRVAHERRPFTAEDRAHVLDSLRSRIPDLDASGTDWPTHYGSIGRLAVDGHGHLYVFGVQPPLTPPPEIVDVDVYAADGERLFTGTMPYLRWTAASGDFVYADRRNEDTEEQEPVRYRLLEPFGRGPSARQAPRSGRRPGG